MKRVLLLLALVATAPGPLRAQDDADVEKRVAAMVERIMRFDANGDDQVSREEAPAWLKSGFKNWDTDGNGVVTRGEVERVAAAFISRQGAPRAADDGRPAEGASVVDVAKGEGISWLGDPVKVLERASRENRPIFLAINALDDERGNVTMAFTRLRHPDVVATTRPYLCLVASPNKHGDGDVCERFGFGPCSDHQAVMSWALRKFAPDGTLTSPQHFVLAPDGSTAFRREFWIGIDDLRRQLETSLVATAPRRALALAVSGRSALIEKLKAGEADALAYAKSDDSLVGGVLLYLWETDGERRERWAAALSALPPRAFSLIRVSLMEDAGLVEIARSIDPKRGAWWAAYHDLEAADDDKPVPVAPPLAAAFKKLRDGDASGLDLLLDALSHPVDGPGVRAALAGLAGRDVGSHPDAWREEFRR